VPRLAGSRFARENEQRLKRKSLQDFPKLISHPARYTRGRNQLSLNRYVQLNREPKLRCKS